MARKQLFYPLVSSTLLTFLLGCQATVNEVPTTLGNSSSASSNDLSIPLFSTQNSSGTSFVKIRDNNYNVPNETLTAGIPSAPSGVPSMYNGTLLQLQAQQNYDGTKDGEYANILNSLLVTASADNSGDQAYAIANTTVYKAAHTYSGIIGGGQNLAVAYDGTVSTVSGFSGVADVLGATSTSAIGVQANAVAGSSTVTPNTASSVTNLVGLQASTNAGAGISGWVTTVTNAYGVKASAGASASNGGTATVTNAYDAYLTNGNATNTGTVTNAYGLYIENINIGNTLNYSIYSAGGTNYLAGNLGVGTANPQATLDINGTMKLAKFSAQPYACDVNHDGAIALTHLYTTCVCTGSAWVKTVDGSTVCVW